RLPFYRPRVAGVSWEMMVECVRSGLLIGMDEEGEVNAYWAPNIESKKDKSTTNSLKRKDVEGPSLDGGSKHEEPLDVDNCDSDASKNENNDSDSSSEMSSTSRLMREKLGSPPRLSLAATSDPSHIGTSDVARVFVSRHGLVRKGAAAVGFPGKVGEKSIRRQLDPMDMLARSALASDEECDQIPEDDFATASCGEEIDLTFFPLSLGRYVMPYSFECDSSPEYTHQQWDGTHDLEDNIYLLLLPKLVLEKILNVRSSNELARTDAKLSDQTLVVGDFQNELALEISKSQEYRNTVVAVEDCFDVLKDKVTRFVGSDVECLVCRLLSSDEFNFALARVLYIGITSSVERVPKLSLIKLLPLSQFPSTNFSFPSKVVAADVGSLLEVVNIQPDKIVCSATPSSVPATPFSANEALSPASTPKDSQHAPDV
nr:hypothetical protein CTI12_AA053730 [Tanacetum cinerariifolium]